MTDVVPSVTVVVTVQRLSTPMGETSTVPGDVIVEAAPRTRLPNRLPIWQNGMVMERLAQILVVM